MRLCCKVSNEIIGVIMRQLRQLNTFPCKGFVAVLDLASLFLVSAQTLLQVNEGCCLFLCCTKQLLLLPSAARYLTPSASYHSYEI